MKLTVEDLDDVLGEDEDFILKNRNILEKMAVVTLIEAMRSDGDMETRIEAAAKVLQALGKDKGQSQLPVNPSQNNTQINVFLPQMAKAIEGLQGVMKAVTPLQQVEDKDDSLSQN